MASALRILLAASVWVLPLAHSMDGPTVVRRASVCARVSQQQPERRGLNPEAALTTNHNRLGGVLPANRLHEIMRNVNPHLSWRRQAPSDVGVTVVLPNVVLPKWHRNPPTLRHQGCERCFPQSWPMRSASSGLLGGAGARNECDFAFSTCGPRAFGTLISQAGAWTEVLGGRRIWRKPVGSDWHDLCLSDAASRAATHERTCTAAGYARAQAGRHQRRK